MAKSDLLAGYLPFVYFQRIEYVALLRALLLYTSYMYIELSYTEVRQKNQKYDDNNAQQKKKK